MNKNYRALLAIRGLHAGADIPEGAVFALSAKLAGDLRGLVEETDETPTFDLEAKDGLMQVVGVDPSDRVALVEALTALNAVVILPHDDGSLDLRDLPATALLSGVLSKIETGEIGQAELSLIITDDMALADLGYRLDNGLASDKVSALLPLPEPVDIGADAGAGAEQTEAAPAADAKKSTKKTVAQE